MDDEQPESDRRRRFFRRIVYWTPKLLDKVANGGARTCEIALGTRRYPDGRRIQLTLVAKLLNSHGGGVRGASEEKIRWKEEE